MGKSKPVKGMEFTDTTGKQRREIRPKVSRRGTLNCRYKYHEHFPEQDRIDICREYINTGR